MNGFTGAGGETNARRFLANYNSAVQRTEKGQNAMARKIQNAIDNGYLYASLGGEMHTKDEDENMNSSNLIFNKTDVEKITSVGVPAPDIYFENNGKKIYYVKPENNGEAYMIKPGQVYLGRIDGFASEEFGVYKVPDFTRVTVAPDDYFIFTKTLLWEAVHRLLDYKVQRLDTNWLIDIQKGGDRGWDKLFNSFR